MRKIIIAILSLLSLQTFASNRYFSSAGSDAANGLTPATAYATITKFNSIFSSLSPGDTCFFRSGDTWKGVQMLPNRSGSSGSPIVITSYSTGALPIISGGVTLASWSSVGSGIWKSSLSVRPAVVVINGVQVKEGRYPNSSTTDAGWLNADAVSSNHLTSSGLTGQTGLVGADVVTRNGRFTIDRFTITSQVGTTIGFPGNIDVDYGFFITNKLSTLDQYGEWFYNDATDELYVYFGGAGSTSVTVSNLNNVLTVDSRSYLKFVNISFQFGQTTAANPLVKLDDNDNISFINCEFKYSGKTAILAGYSTNGNTNLTISGCLIQDINCSGIMIYGNVSNDNLVVTGNTFLRCGFIAGQGENGEYIGLGLMNSNTDNATVTLNSFDSTGWIPIMAGGGGTNLLIYKNYITNFCYFLDDGGGIYLQSHEEKINKRVRKNIIIHGGLLASEGTDNPSSKEAYGIYVDAGSTYITADSNYIQDVGNGGMFMDDSHDITYRLNTIYQALRGITVEYYNSHPITNMSIKKNIIYADADDNYVLRYANQDCGGAAMTTWGVSDSNYLMRPTDESGTKIMGSITCSSFTYYTLTSWRSATSYDTHSNNSPAFVTTSNATPFTNPTNATVNVSTSRKYKDSYGNISDGTVTLAPYEGVLLFDIGAASGIPPVANAGIDQSITISTVTLNGTGSTDADGTIVSYAWVKLSGTGGTITSPSSAITTVTGLTTGTYVYQLTVTDNNSLTDSDNTTITVNIPGNNGTILTVQRRIIISTNH